MRQGSTIAGRLPPATSPPTLKLISLMGLPDGATDVESQLLFEDEVFFAAPVGSHHAEQREVDLGACADERFVSLTRRVRHIGRIHGGVSHRRF